MVNIYLVVNRFNGKSYVGKTGKLLAKRWAEHVCNAKRGKPAHFAKAIRKHGPEAFDVVMLARAENHSAASLLERRWIEILQTSNSKIGYNSTLGGDGTNGWKHRPETRSKISEAHIGKIFSPETLNKMRMAHRRENLRPETIAKMRAAKLGRKLNPETIAKLRETSKRENLSCETLAKMREASKRENLSAETLAKRRAALMGHKGNVLAHVAASEVQKLRGEGKSARELSRLFGASIATIYNRLRVPPCNLEKLAEGGD